MIVAGIDVGTQSAKAVVYDAERKNIIASGSMAINLISTEGGVREQKAEWWIDAIKGCFDQIDPAIKKAVSAISVSGQQHGFVPVAENGKVLYNVKLWCDTSTANECSILERSFGGEERLFSECGNRILPGYTASKILWFFNNHKDLYDRMKYVMLPHDYINYYLTGKAIMEMGDASGTGLLNIRTAKWNKELCDAISPSLIDKLPRVIEEPAIIADILPAVASELGLSESCIVVSGGGDNMMSAIGTGAVKDGIVAISLGTSGTLFSSASYPVVDKKGRLAAFCSSHGTWLPLLCTMNCTVASEVFRKQMGLSAKEFDAEAEKAPIGSEGIVLLPFLNGERVPDLPKGEGVLGGISIDNLKNSNIARAVLEGVTFEFLLGLDAFKEHGMSFDKAILTGGGANSPFWRQLVADITGLQVVVPAIKESAAFGAALQAYAVASGISVEDVCALHVLYDESKDVSPDFENTVRYKAVYKKWISYVSNLESLFR